MTSAETADEPHPPVRLVVGRVLRAHGLRGEVVVEVRTDSVAQRFAPGSVLVTDPDLGPLTVSGTRRHHDRLLVRFAGRGDRDAAETLRGVTLLVEAGSTEAGDGGWFAHELVGCTVTDPGGTELGEVVGLQPSPAHDLLVVAHGGREVLVPFVSAIVPSVDTQTRRVVVDPPDGLLDL